MKLPHNFTLPNGIQIDFEGGLSKQLTLHALSKGLKNIFGALATDTLGYKEYIIIKDNEVVYASQNFEQAAVHIDIIKIQEDYSEVK